MSDATRQTASTAVSTRVPERVARDAAMSGRQDGPVLLLVVEDLAGAADDTGERILVDVDRKPRFLVQDQVQSTDQRAAAGHDDTAVDDVRGQLGWRDFERAPHRVDDLLDRLLDRLADFR